MLKLVAEYKSLALERNFVHCLSVVKAAVFGKEQMNIHFHVRMN